MSRLDYRIDLDDLFAGPLDLLLYLVRRNEVDAGELPIARITAEFLEYLKVLEFLDLDLAADFVVMAGSLLEIKSRFVLPQPEPEEAEPPAEEETGSPSELITQLLKYKKYKEAAAALEERAAAWQERYPRLSDEQPAATKDPAADAIRNVELWDLVSAFSRILEKKVVEEETRVRYDETPIAVYVERVATRVCTDGRTAFSSFFTEAHERPTIVAVFLAVLELLRNHGFRAEQPVEYGEIWIRPPMDQAGGGVIE